MGQIIEIDMVDRLREVDSNYYEKKVYDRSRVRCQP